MNRLKKFFLLIILPVVLHAQKEANNWYFCTAALNFSNGYPMPMTNSAMPYSPLSCASISDRNGNLLFYTNGITVWNRNDTVMYNGNQISGIISSPFNPSLSLIVPQPNSDLYYIFVCDDFWYSNSRLTYTIVDMKQQNGLGRVVIKNCVLLNSVSTKLTSYKHSNNNGIWLISHGINNDIFYSYLITSSGLNLTPVISHAGMAHDTNDKAGYMRISPSGNKLACAKRVNSTVELFDFDNNTGTVSNAHLLSNSSTINCPYGVEFSPDGSKLYVSCDAGSNRIFQFNLSSNNITTIINSLTDVSGRIGASGCAMQVGLDGKIYVALYSGTHMFYLSVINNPNSLGTSCNYVTNAVYLAGKTVHYGLPVFNQDYFFIPEFTAKPLCFGDSTKFTISYISGIDSVKWNFDDNASGMKNSSKLFSPKHQFTDTGLYTITLISFHLGIPDTSYRNLKISHKPHSVFSVNDTSQCLNGNYFLFTNNSTINGGSMSFEWDFGDTTHTFDSFTTHHTYVFDKTYKIKLIALSDYGCTDTFSRNVIVKPSPEALFNFNAKDRCLKANQFIFTNNSTISDTSILLYHWQFGDGDSSALKDPSHSYSSPLSYLVSLIVNSNKGCNDTFYDFITVYPQSQPGFTVNDSTQCLIGNQFNYNNTSSSQPVIISWQWLFGDGKTNTSMSAKHTYNSPGTYTVKLISTTLNNCKDTFSKTITVQSMPDTAFSVNDIVQCLKGNLFVFNSKQKTTDRKQWDFGDGVTDTGYMVSHVYADTGQYLVKLFVENKFGCIDTGQKIVSVNPLPDATFSVVDTVQCLNGNLFGFYSQQSTVNSRQWDFGDGGIDTGSNVIHSYINPGNYIVKLVVENSFGCRDTGLKNVIVNPSPDASFSVNDTVQCLKGNLFGFSHLSLVNGHWWNYGDGAADTGSNVEYSYLNHGNYDVKLVVENKFGCKDSNQITITVYPSPDAGFNVNDTDQCLNKNLFAFSHWSSVIGHWWEFGDGRNDTAKTCYHKYLIAETFNVKLKVVNNFGCYDSSARQVIVFPSPDAAFSVNDTVQCLNGNLFVFSHSSLVNSHWWDFGDETNDTSDPGIHSYSSIGNYPVRLVVSTKGNCTDTSVKTVTTLPNPPIPYTSTNSPLCEGDTLFLTAYSPGNVTYSWSGGNNFKSTIQNPIIYSIRVNDAGNYTVKSILDGCESDPAVADVEVYPNPVFTFGKDKTICGNDFIILDPGLFNLYLWHDNSTQRTFKATNPGIYYVKVFNEFNCYYSDTIIINEKCPSVLFIPQAFSPNNDGHNDYFEIITANVKDFDLRIFNRWGEEVFYSNDVYKSWDGSFRGNPSETGMYYYQLFLRDLDGATRYVTGRVSVIR